MRVLSATDGCRVGKFPLGVYYRGSQFLPRDLLMSHSLEPLVRLMMTLRERAETLPAGSYTTKLMTGGPEKIGAKIREEADELIEAANVLEKDLKDDETLKARDHFIYEAGDLIYHTMVLLAYRGVDIGEVADELSRREGTSGLVEKANREKPSS